MRRTAVALVHYPVLDKQGAVVTSAITNLDIHDIARSAMTFGLVGFYVVHPIEAQRLLVSRILEHWICGSGGRRIPDRIAPMQLVRVASTLQDVIEQFAEDHSLQVWTTSATAVSDSRNLSHDLAARQLLQSGPPVLLVLGTGWGLAQAVHDVATHRLLPIRAQNPGEYNHLSVRAAAAILFDRLLGERPARPDLGS